jgi:FKBP-type peptidyl-prolyl cis-trans isomerase FkpA
MNNLTKIFFTFFISILILAACKKQKNDSCAPVPPASEASAIAGFCTASGINYTVDSNGIYYQIISSGAGAKPNMNSTITVTYSTNLLNGEVIDTAHFINPVSKPLNQFIEGWQIAIPYIQKGGHIKMVIPSALAYGCVGVENLVPANAPLYYDVFLMDVSN